MEKSYKIQKTENVLRKISILFKGDYMMYMMWYYMILFIA